MIEVPAAQWCTTPKRVNNICDVTEHEQEVILLKGGRGGLGNWHFENRHTPGSPLCTTGRTDAGVDGNHGTEADWQTSVW